MANKKEYSKEIEEVTRIVEDWKVDFTKFHEANNGAAGKRARKALMDLKKIAHQMRIDIQESKNSSS